MTEDRQPPPDAGPTGQPELVAESPPAPEPAPITAEPPSGQDAAGATSTTATEPPPPAAARTRTRWAVAGIVGLLVVALTAVGLVALVGGPKTSSAAAWTPSDALAYTEVRADWPGDQHQNLGRFLAHFPGFADQSLLDQKLDEMLDRLIGTSTAGKRDWSKEIKPWFGGQVGVSVSSLPRSGTDAGAVRMLLVATQKDPAGAVAWLASLGGPQTTPETYKGTTLQVTGGDGPGRFAYTATAGVLLFGDPDSVKAAIDRNGTNGLATNRAFLDAMAGIEADQVSRSYIDLKRYLEAALAMAGSDVSAGATFSRTLLDKAPAWAAFGGRIESDALVGRALVPHVASSLTQVNRASTIGTKLPASTIALIETHDFGTGLKATFDQLKSDPSLGTAFGQLDQAVALLGGMDTLIGWIGDAGIVLTADGGTPSGGIVIVPTDPTKAEQFFTSLKNFASLAGATGGVTVHDDPYGDGTITTVDLGDLRQLLGAATAGSGVPDLPLAGRVEISFSVQRGLAIVGVGPGFVKSVLDVKAGSALADQARFRDALSRVGTKNVSSVFVDLAAIRKLAEPLASSLPEGGTYSTELKPYLQPFDVLAAAGVTGDRVDTATFILTATKP
jgi:hypothetical protein